MIVRNNFGSKYVNVLLEEQTLNKENSWHNEQELENSFQKKIEFRIKVTLNKEQYIKVIDDDDDDDDNNKAFPKALLPLSVYVYITQKACFPLSVYICTELKTTSLL
jgi:hypothetical protein